MKINTHFSQAEGYDSETSDLLFRIEAFDEVCFKVGIHTVVTAGSWGEISDEILKALKLMEKPNAE